MQHIRGINGPILGKFRLAAVTGLTTGMAANAPIFSARFAPTAAVRACIADLRLKVQIITPFTAANEISCQAFIARSFTASDSGGTSVLPATLNNMISSISDSALSPVTQFTDIRVAGAAALTAGTRTLDANPFLYLPAAQVLAAASAAQSYSESDYSPYSDQRFGINLQGQTGAVAANAEGIIVTVPIAQGAAGTVRYAIEMEWYEYVTNSAETIG